MTEAEFLERYHKLKKMRFSGMAEELKVQFNDPDVQKISSDERIFRLIDAECETRENKKFARLIKSADLRYPDASINQILLGELETDRTLLEYLTKCRWIDDRKNLLICGKTGTGKSYCACALGIAAAAGFRTVRYYKASELLRLLQNAEDNRILSEELKRLASFDLLIIDDFGLMDLNPDMCRNLFELIDARDGRKSTIFCSQLPVSKWYGLFEELTYADACLDRLTGSGSYRLTFEGESLRKQRQGA